MSLIWIVVGIFNLPMWALDHARPPYHCEAFHSEYQHDISIGYCENMVQQTFVAGRWAGSSSFIEIGTYVKVE